MLTIFMEKHVGHPLSHRKLAPGFGTYQLSLNEVNLHKSVVHFSQHGFIFFHLLRHLLDEGVHGFAVGAAGVEIRDGMIGRRSTLGGGE